MIYRMFYGMRPMNSPKGIPTNAVFGFVKVLIKLKKEYNPDYLAVAFDTSQPTFRHKMYQEYKAGREKMPEDLKVQEGILNELLEAMGVKILRKPGYEADDILGTISREAEKEDVKTYLVTGDRDSYQLVDKDTSVLYTATRSGNQFVDVTPQYIEEKYGIEPEELKVVKALMGDKSDNIPGIQGIGEKTALKLVKGYKTLDNLYAHIDEQKGKLKERLVLGEESAYASLALGTIDTEVPLDTPLEALKSGPFLTDKSEEIMRDLGFKSILNTLEAPKTDESTPGAPKKTRYIHVTKPDEAMMMLRKLNTKKEMTMNVWTEDPPEDKTHMDFSGAYLAVEIDSIYYYISDMAVVRKFLGGLAAIPNADDVQLSGHNLKHVEKLYTLCNANIANYTYDSYIASYLNDPSNGQYDLGAIASRWLDETYPSEEEFFGKGKKRKTASEMGDEAMAEWLVTGCALIKQTKPMLLEKIKEDGMDVLFTDIELALIPVLDDMEETGFKVDPEILKELSSSFSERIEKLSREIFEEADVEPFNIGSPKQLGEVLFEKMGLPVIKKTKTGYSTSAEVLKELEPYSPVVEKILEYRMLTKLDSTYGKGLLEFIDPKTDKIYTTFQQTVTSTGRLSSTDPNLQNIPVKTSEGREIRKAFIASAPDRILVDADYSQIELRILAALSGDPAMIEAFKEGEDVHARTAARVFNEGRSDVTPEQRRFAKMINFGLIYGKQAFSLANDLGVSRQEAQGFIDRYFEQFPKVQAFLNSLVEEAKQKGYAETIWGRRRYLPEINSKNRIVMQSGERQALNMPIQGAAADIMKIAMIKVWQRLREENLDAKIVLQVHDELIIDCDRDIADYVKELLVETMENAVKLDVPLSVEADTAYSWYDAK